MKLFRAALDSDDAAENLLRTVAAMHGFDLQAWDAWVSQLDSCGAKEELAERRERAKRASSSAEMLRHLEWMVMRRREIRREDFLLPLARTGNKVRKPFENRNDEQKREADKKRAEWQKQADVLWAQNPRLSKARVGELIAEKEATRGVPVSAGTIRNNILKPKK
ncbi:MAG: hypothetical protein RSP_15810 [Rhodanobacter sp.]